VHQDGDLCARLRRAARHRPIDFVLARALRVHEVQTQAREGRIRGAPSMRGPNPNDDGVRGVIAGKFPVSSN
jgi:hypothetical protein